jgi:hypothetical protein
MRIVHALVAATLVATTLSTNAMADSSEFTFTLLSRTCADLQRPGGNGVTALLPGCTTQVLASRKKDGLIVLYGAEELGAAGTKLSCHVASKQPNFAGQTSIILEPLDKDGSTVTHLTSSRTGFGFWRGSTEDGNLSYCYSSAGTGPLYTCIPAPPMDSCPG